MSVSWYELGLERGQERISCFEVYGLDNSSLTNPSACISKEAATISPSLLGEVNIYMTAFIVVNGDDKSGPENSSTADR